MFYNHSHVQYYDFSFLNKEYRLEVTDNYVGTFYICDDATGNYKDNYIEQKLFKTQENLDSFLTHLENAGIILKSLQ